MNDAALVEAFERCTLSLAEWTHRAHVKVAFLYLRELPLDAALDKMRSGLQAFLAAKEVPVSETMGYNETTTRAMMQLIQTTSAAYGELFPTPNADAFCDAHPQLMSKHVLRLFYSPRRRIHPEAKSRFIEPDLAPLPVLPANG